MTNVEATARFNWVISCAPKQRAITTPIPFPTPRANPITSSKIAAVAPTPASAFGPK